MVDKRISELPVSAAITGTELLPVVQNGNTVRTTISAILPAPVTTSEVFLVGPPAAGTTAGKDKVKALAAIDAAKAATKGGTVQFGPGIYNVGDLAILWPEYNGTSKAIHLVGAGDKSTVLHFSVDRGLNTYAIAGDYAGGALTSFNSGLYENTISHMRIVGPGTRGTIGTSPCNMNGVMADTHVRMYQVDISLFRYGINAAGNHNSFIDCTFGNNYYGAYHSAVAGLGGSVIFYNCGMAGNLHSGHAISPTAVASFVMFEGHLGFEPYAIYMESGRTAGTFAMTHCMFHATNFEYIGNGTIYSEDQNAGVTETRFIGCANFSSNNASYGLPASAHTTQIRLHSFTKCSFTETYMGGSPTLSYLDISSALNAITFDFGSDLVKNSLTRNIPLVLGPAGRNQASVILRGQGNYRAEAVPADSSAAIVANRLVEWTQYRAVRPHGQWGSTIRTRIAGVAQNAVAASAREYVMVVQEGNDILVDIDGTEPTPTQVLVPSSTTPSKAMAASWDGTTATVTRPIIGQFYLAGAPAGQTKAYINIP